MAGLWPWTKRRLFSLLWLAAFLLVLGAGLDYAIERYQRKEAKQVPFVATTLARRGDFVVYHDLVGKLEAEKEDKFGLDDIFNS